MIRLAAALLLAAGSIGAAPSPAATSPDAAALATLQRDDHRFQSLGWRLATANAPYCAHAAPAIGLLLQDMRAYGDPARMRRAAGIEGDIAVEAVAAGSPAEAAGLSPNDEIIAVDGAAIASFPSDSAAPWQRGVTLQERIEAAMARDGNVTIDWRARDGQLHSKVIAGVPACPTRWELHESGDDALAEGTRVVIGRDHPTFAYADDELAALMAHELAHNIFRHRDWLNAHGRKQRDIRRTEREADRLMPWLLANAGFDPAAAARWMRHWGPKHDGGILRKRDHEGWDERLEAIEAEIPLVRAAMAQTGRADWKAGFRRDIAP